MSLCLCLYAYLCLCMYVIHRCNFEFQTRIWPWKSLKLIKQMIFLPWYSRFLSLNTKFDKNFDMWSFIKTAWWNLQIFIFCEFSLNSKRFLKYWRNWYPNVKKFHRSEFIFKDSFEILKFQFTVLYGKLSFES